jgi:hypothetical protein
MNRDSYHRCPGRWNTEMYYFRDPYDLDVCIIREGALMAEIAPRTDRL